MSGDLVFVAATQGKPLDHLALEAGGLEFLGAMGLTIRETVLGRLPLLGHCADRRLKHIGVAGPAFPTVSCVWPPEPLRSGSRGLLWRAVTPSPWGQPRAPSEGVWWGREAALRVSFRATARCSFVLTGRLY